MSTSPRLQRTVYSDLHTSFEKHPITDALLLKKNDDAVKQSVKNIILTNRGERLYQPDIGGDIRALLFENLTQQTVFTAEQIIRDTLAAHEPRADVIDVVVASGPDENSVGITIVFRAVNIQEPVTVEVVLERVR